MQVSFSSFFPNERGFNHDFDIDQDFDLTSNIKSNTLNTPNTSNTPNMSNLNVTKKTIVNTFSPKPIMFSWFAYISTLGKNFNFDRWCLN
jgi:hypothetical protein